MDKNKLLPPTENSIGRRPESFQTDVYDVPAPSITDDATMLGTIEETRAIATTEVNVLVRRVYSLTNIDRFSKKTPRLRRLQPMSPRPWTARLESKNARTHSHLYRTIRTPRFLIIQNDRAAFISQMASGNEY